jgi:hypothetical protein
MQFDEFDSRRKLVSAESHRFHTTLSATHELFGLLTLGMRVASTLLKMDRFFEPQCRGFPIRMSY